MKISGKGDEILFSQDEYDHILHQIFLFFFDFLSKDAAFLLFITFNVLLLHFYIYRYDPVPVEKIIIAFDLGMKFKSFPLLFSNLPQ